MEEEEIRKLAFTFLKSNLATNMTEALEKAKAAMGAEEILKKLQSRDSILNENKTVNELMGKEESSEIAPKEPAKEENIPKEAEKKREGVKLEEDDESDDEEEKEEE